MRTLEGLAFEMAFAIGRYSDSNPDGRQITSTPHPFALHIACLIA
jgi:hypothetical protein